MRITRIELENFKGIGARQIIELRPITLLFGANSAGKSTIIQALHYLREILEKDNVDADVTQAGGYMNLGGFKNLVHQKNLKNPIIIKVVMERDQRGFSGMPLNIYGNMAGGEDFDKLPIMYIPSWTADDYGEVYGGAQVNEIGIEIEIQWNEQDDKPFVARHSIEMDAKHIADVVTSSSGDISIENFNLEHPLLFSDSSQDTAADENRPTTSPLEPELYHWLKYGLHHGTPPPLDEESQEIIIPITYSDFSVIPKGQIWGLGLGFEGLDFADTIEDDLSRDHNYVVSKNWDSIMKRQSAVTDLLTELIWGPAKSIRDHLRTMTYIGPIRKLPPRSFMPQKTPDESRWATGLAAWDIVYDELKKDEELMEDVNYWLSGKGLNTGYQLQRRKHGNIRMDEDVGTMFENVISTKGLDGIEDFLGSILGQQSDVTLVDTRSNTPVEPVEIGIGISQLLPIVLMAVRKQETIDDPGGILVVEQPELHIHPALQVRLGDLFIHASREQTEDDDTTHNAPAEKSLIIETHSEHLLLRLLRRVREQTENKLPDGFLGLEPEDLSVMYVENDNEKGVRFRRLRITPDGDFKDRWPGGFFEERDEELF